MSGLVGEVLRGGGQTFRLHRRVAGARGRSCRLSVVTHGVGHEADVDAAVVGASGGRLVGLNWLVFAEADHINLVSRHVVFGREVLNHRIGAALTEVIVVVSR